MKRNVVDSACLFLEDMAGIYTNFNNGANSGMVIEENFVFNTIGERLGAPEAYSMANGIYVDNLSTGVTVRNNTVAFVKGMGLYTNFNNTGNELHNNTSFSSGVNELNVHKPNSAPGYVMADNILVANVTDPNHDVFNSNVTFDFTFEDMGYYTNNYVINPYSDKTIEVSYKDNGFKRIERFTPYEWEAAAPQINGTISSPVKYASSVNPNDVIKFYYNKTQSTQTYTLPSGRFIDAKNIAYCGTTALAPYTSVILFKVDDNACSGASVCSHTLSVNVDSLAGSSVKLSWNAITESFNYDIRYKPEADSVWKYAHNVRDTSFVLTNLLPKTYYAYELRVSCYGKEGDWQTFPAFKSEDYAGEHVFINATLENCSPASSFSAVHSTTDNKWTIQNSGGVGTVDKDYLTSNSAVENSPEFTLNVVNQLDPCATYDIYIYYLSPITQPWKIKARLNTDSAFVTYDRFTLGAELLTDYIGTATSNRLYRAKIGTIQGQSDISVVFDDIYYGVSSSRSVLDGIGFRKISNNVPSEPDSLQFITLSPDSMRISWRDNAVDETGYIIERKNGNSSFVQIASLGANTQTYLDTTAIAGKFSYRVYATKGSCKSSFSKIVYADNTDAEHVFINANNDNCTPTSSFSSTQSVTDNKWTLANSGGVGTVDRDMIVAYSSTENAPEFTLTAANRLDPFSQYDIYVYYLSPATQPWKIKARFTSDSTFVTYDRNTPGAELLADYTGT
ncbi:MAG: fibronectin type III domain-containing protein, partial [Pedobacter sp.]